MIDSLFQDIFTMAPGLILALTAVGLGVSPEILEWVMADLSTCLQQSHPGHAFGDDPWHGSLGNP